MSHTVVMLAAVLQSLFTTTADQLARECGLVRRRRSLDGAAFAQATVLGWMHQPDASLEDLADFAAERGLTVSRQALDQRFTPQAVTFLRQLLEQALHQAFQAPTPVLPLLQRFNGTYLFDTSAFTLPASLAEVLPGCGGSTAEAGQAAVKVQVCLEVSAQGVVELALADGRTNELEMPLAHRPLPAGALRLADLGFFDLALLEDATQAGVCWISRLPAGTTVTDAAGQRGKQLALLQARGGGGLDEEVFLGAHRVPARLVAVRVPEEVAHRRRQKLRQRAAKRGDHLSAERLALCTWEIWVTNVPAEELRVVELQTLYRVRWQVELLFKWWKSGGRLDRTAAHKPDRVRAEILAKLLGLVVQGWLLLVLGGTMLELSYRRGSRRLRRVARRVLVSLQSGLEELVAVLGHLSGRLKRCRVEARRQRPATWQTLLNEDDPQYASGAYGVT